MTHKCTQCQAETIVDLTFSYEQAVCKTCYKFSNSSKKFKSLINKSTLVLNLNQKGELFGTEYTVTGIVVKKHGVLFSWREYHLRGRNNEIAYLSESDGHWIFLKRCDEKVQYIGKVAIYKGDTYRWYEDTACHVVHAEGFFEKSLTTTTHKMYEYVLKQRILSSDDLEDCIGEHISKKQIKKAFDVSGMPRRYGVGLLQPYYFDVQASAKLLGLFLIAIITIHFVIVSWRTNVKVYDGHINTFSNAFEEVVSNSFTLKGGVAPLYVEAVADVNNNWVNIEIALVNEKTNEVLVANRDIEFYSGRDGGEDWSEGSKKAKFNFCSIPKGTYHLVIQTNNGFTAPEPQFSDSSVQLEKSVDAVLNAEGQIILTDFRFTEIQVDTNHISEVRDDYYFNQAKQYFLSKDKEQAILDIQMANLKGTSRTNNVDLTVIWNPNNFWNLVFCSATLIIIFILIAWGQNLFERKKWTNSPNSPYNS